MADFQRFMFELLPNEFYKILTSTCRKKTYAELLDGFDEADRETAKEYFEYLLAKEYAFLCDKDEIALFPPLATTWDYPAEISNAIIDFKKVPASFAMHHSFIQQLDELGCCDIQFRCFCSMPVVKLKELYAMIAKTGIYRTELLIRYDPEVSLDEYSAFMNATPYVNTLFLHGFPENKAITLASDQKFYCITEVLPDESCCGNIGFHYFNLSITHYTESLHFNTCLNRKISLSADGHIRNCPSLKDSYGHISKVSLKEVIRKKKFSGFGRIRKDQIDDCKVCEYRNVCTDCRAYTIGNSITGKPAKCRYDPYKGVWL